MTDDINNDLPFNGLTLEQRHHAALKQTTAVVQALMPFLATLQPGRAPDPVMQRNAAHGALMATQDLLKTLLLNELVAAAIIHMLGPPPPVDAPEDAHNLRVIKELHVLLDFLAPIVRLDSVAAGQADLGRLENRQAPLTIKRDYYGDPRLRDGTELADREFTVLLVSYLAAKWQEKIPNLLERLALGVSFSAFEKWAVQVPLGQRRLMIEAGRLNREDAGLPLEQQGGLSPRSCAVLARHDAALFPSLAELSDEDMLRKLFARATRSGPFA